MPRRKKSAIEKVKDGLTKLATGDIKDAVSLLYFDKEEALEKLPKLDLFNISEIKMPKTGGMEIKFFDRIKALEKLSELDGENSSGEYGLYRALEKCADSLNGSDGSD